MSKIIEVRYNGEIGFKTKIKDVVKFLKIKLSVEDFLKFQNAEGISNSQAIFNAYKLMEGIRLNLFDETGAEMKDHTAITGDMPCPEPIVFAADSQTVTVDLIVNQSNLLINDQEVIGFGDDNSDVQAFNVNLGTFYKNNIANVIEVTALNVNKEMGVRRMPRMRVWVWCKSLNNDGCFSDYSIFDLSPFISACTINQTDTGGNFSFNLEPINGLIQISDGVLSGVWVPDKRQYVKFDQDGIMNYVVKKVLDDEGTVGGIRMASYGKRYQNTRTNNVNYPDVTINPDVSSNTWLRSEDLFKNLIAENDLVFISFDREETPEDIIDDFFVNCSELPSKDWDMIALVDSSGIATEYEGSSTTISVSGRDLMKLLIEDGSYFFAKSYSNPDNENGIFNNVNLQNAGDGVNTTNNRVSEVNPKGINRLITTGIIDMLYNPSARNVQFVMNLLMSRLANVEICHSDLFKYYGDRRTEFQIPFFEVAESEAQITEEDHAD